MSTYLFNWNPQKWDWKNADPSLDEEVELCRKNCGLQSSWSSGRTQRIEKGDRIFLIKLGRELPSGIMASGFALGSPEDIDSRFGLNVEIYFDVLLHPYKEDILHRSFLKEQIPSVHWTPQSSGVTIQPEEAAHLEDLWASHLDGLGLSTIQFSEEISTPERYWEGATYRITVNRYERDARARKDCIRHHGCKCAVCGFDFESVYGIGKGFIHVHHLKPLADIGEEYEVNPVTDLIPVCPNCHAMLHWNSPALTCEELRAKRDQQCLAS